MHPVNTASELVEKLLAEAKQIAEEDVATNLRMANNGATLIDDGDTIIHHCNTGALATVDWGTALGCIRRAHEQGKHVHVLVDETRPRLQGSRLTAWELEQWGIPYEIIPDGAAGYFLHRGDVQKVMFGADRVAANGDVANKIGSYMLALAAHANGVPVYSVFPTTADLSLATGDEIPIEERDADEVLGITFQGKQWLPRAPRREPGIRRDPARVVDRAGDRPRHRQAAIRNQSTSRPARGIKKEHFHVHSLYRLHCLRLSDDVPGLLP